MLIGLTYDLKEDYLALGYNEEEVAEFDKLETIEAIENALNNLGHKTERIGHIKNLTTALVNGKSWDLIFNIAEGMHGLAREAQIPALLEAYNIPFVFSDASVLSITLNKGITKLILDKYGINTPKFYVITNIEELNNVEIDYPLFVKPVAEGTSKGISNLSKVNNKQELKIIVNNILHKFKQPALIEEFLPGREFTVGIIGTGDNAFALGAMEIVLKNKDNAIYSYDVKDNYQELVEYTLAEDKVAIESMELAIKAWNVLNCRDGGRVDIRIDKYGKPSFIEVNPLAGLNPIHSDLPLLCYAKGITYNTLIKCFIDSVLKRINPE